MRKSLAIGINSFKDAIRQKVLLLFAFIAIVLMGLSYFIMGIDLGIGQMRFVADFADGAIGFFGCIIAIIASCQLIQSEYENKSAYLIFSKPVSFFNFCFGKLTGISCLLTLYVLCILVVCIPLLYYIEYTFRNVPAELLVGSKLSINLVGCFVYGIMQILKLCVICSFSILLCSLSKSLMFSMVMSFCVYGICLLQGLSFSTSSYISKWVLVVFPNFSIFDSSKEFLFLPVNYGEFGYAIVYSAIYMTAFCLISSYALSKREL